MTDLDGKNQLTEGLFRTTARRFTNVGQLTLFQIPSPRPCSTQWGDGFEEPAPRTMSILKGRLFWPLTRYDTVSFPRFPLLLR